MNIAKAVLRLTSGPTKQKNFRLHTALLKIIEPLCAEEERTLTEVIEEQLVLLAVEKGKVGE